MRIGYLTGQYPRATDTFIQREVTSLRELGSEVRTFSIRRPGWEQIVGEEQRAELEQTTYLLPPSLLALLKAHLLLLVSAFSQYVGGLRLALKTSQPGIRGLLYQLFYFAEAGLLALQLRRQGIQHLHNHLADSSCTVAMLAARLADISFSFTIHGPYIFFEPYRWCLREKIEQALFVACISDFCRSQCMFFSSAACWAKLAIVHCGVDPEQFAPVHHSGLGSRLLYVGRLSVAKGLPVLFEAMAALKEVAPQLRLQVVGDGCDRTLLEQLASQLGLDEQVEFLGYRSQREVRQYLQTSDLFVLPSFAEGVPVSLMEAMAAGVPVISTRIAGISELVEDGHSGYLVAPGNGQQLAERVYRLWADAELRQAFGEAGRQQVSQAFNLAHEVSWLHRIFQATLQEATIPERAGHDQPLESSLP